ncbi:sugar phosphate nucleotidyltransferase [Leucobacter denitrificans]|uniref:NTP transferase domain-containing protein n=1 Tax=Leucobacter denitrificans TaxID=683042 RepID=A0A7G9S3H3_9MICO|nr:sugar phosphate nucleotidyltransferase [Leucobacter denitrificans]QNN62398.1 NTP transferase domain-containing protein [Leucobacter denitrificans]
MTEPVAVVLAGGKGQRLWPLSRKNRPKQFVSVVSEKTLIQTTVDRLLSVFPPERIYISTTEKYLSDVCAANIPVPEENIILERRPLGPATAFVLAHAVMQQLHGDNVRVLTCPSDHYVQDPAEFERTIAELADGVFENGATVTVLGAKPTEPDDRLGYMRLEPTKTPDFFHAVTLSEKPSLEEAKELGESGVACWNTANYLAKPGAVLEILRRVYPIHTAEIVAYAKHWVDDVDERTYGYDGVPLEGHELDPFFIADAEVDVLVRDFGWSDVGTWERVLQAREQLGPELPAALIPDSRNIVAISTDGRPIVACGVEDLVIVSHDDAVYVLNRSVASSLESVKEWRAAVAGAGEEGLL